MNPETHAAAPRLNVWRLRPPWANAQGFNISSLRDYLSPEGRNANQQSRGETKHVRQLSPGGTERDSLPRQWQV